MNRSIALVILSLFFCSLVNAQTMMPVNPGSKVEFKVVNHMIGGGTVTGTFDRFSGSIVFNPNRIKDAAFDVTVSIESISTGIGLRDKHLKKEAYFNEPKFPIARIRSTQVTHTAKAGLYLLKGQLTLKGMTRSIEIPFTAVPDGRGWSFKGQLNLNRRDYGVGPDNRIDDMVNVFIDVKAL